jgi:hypothetical protein
MLVWDGRKVNYEALTVPSLITRGICERQGPLGKLNMPPALELHGASIALIPDRMEQTLYKLIFTPVAMSNKKPANFRNLLDYRVLNDLQFSTEFRLTDGPGVRSCFVRIVQHLEILAQRQEASCGCARKETQPLLLIVGQDSARPVDVKALYSQLFGKHLDGPTTSLCPTAADHTLGLSPEHDGFSRAMRKMSEELISGRIAIQKGSFKGAVYGTKGCDLMKAGDIRAARRLRRDPDYYARLAENAFSWGEISGNVLNRYPCAFIVFAACSFDQSEDIRQTFNAGVQSKYRGANNSWVKLLTDPRSPFFVDALLRPDPRP